MKSANLEKLYNYLKSKDNFEFGYNYSNIIECTLNVENALAINFDIVENDGIFDMRYEISFACKVYHVKNFVGSFDEIKEELDKISSKAITLVETLESTIRDSF